MADEEQPEQEVEAAEGGEEDAEQQDSGEDQEEEQGGGQKIMCFVSKEMVPINETVEILYGPGKKVRVLPKFIKYDQDEFEEAVEASA